MLHTFCQHYFKEKAPALSPKLKRTLFWEIIIRFLLGQKNNRLDVVTLEQHLATVFSIIINAEFKLQQYQVFS